MNAYFKGQPVYGPRGPAGPDGNPVGTVISFMGTSAPEDYLVCDGAEYPIGDYPDLAEHFRQQFGAAGHFGGDGENTFAVPDLRNLFLRGYHGEAEEPLSDDIGKKQEGTIYPGIIPATTSSSQNALVVVLENKPSQMYNIKNMDSSLQYGTRHGAFYNDAMATVELGDERFPPVFYTARPVNMAILYCIKAVESLPEENVYSTEEQRIGIWIDGKTICRRVFPFTTPASHSAAGEFVWNATGVRIEDVETLISAKILMSSSDGYLSAGQSTNNLAIKNGELLCSIQGYSTLCSRPAVAIIEYTKAKD